jgi:hypothetical protein
MGLEDARCRKKEPHSESARVGRPTVRREKTQVALRPTLSAAMAAFNSFLAQDVRRNISRDGLPESIAASTGGAEVNAAEDSCVRNLRDHA